MSSIRPSMDTLLVRLPHEIHQQILEHVAYLETTMATPMDIDESSDPTIPIADGSSPLLALPKELRRKIFGYILPPKDKIIEPYKTPSRSQAPASVAPVTAAAPLVPGAPAIHAALPQITQMLQNNQNVPAHILQTLQNIAAQTTQNAAPQLTTQQAGSIATRLKAAKAMKKISLAVGDALVLCKQIAADILVMLYEERTFAVNVYEGISDGGIEFLNSGRQRLQYREHFTQIRFKRFEGPDDPFGFSRIKRLMVRIYPATVAASDQKTSRHDVMHTHFMVRALVKLLKHDGSFGLNRLQIRFVEPRSISWRPYPWQNTSGFSLRSSSIYGISNVEIILRGLFELRQVHVAACELPPGLFRDKTLSGFIDRLIGVITGKLHSSTMDDEIAAKIESAKDMLDDWVHATMFSTQVSRSMPAMLKDSDFDDVKEVDYFRCYPDEDDYLELPARSDIRKKGLTVARYPPRFCNAYEGRITSVDQETNQHKSSELQISNNKMSPSSTNAYNDDISSTARSGRNSPLTSSTRESSGRASLLEMVSIDDEEALPRLGSLLRADLTPTKNRRTRSLAQRINDLGSVARPELRRSERVRARNDAENAIITAAEDRTFEIKDQPPSDMLGQTAGNSTQDNEGSSSSKQDMPQNITNLEDDEEDDLGLRSTFLA
ncbi:hypothetical protein QM012_000995 [Aureobasidium pullulans]|uniref:F-box domain-containing protein n=1 Tax=Aureobasidium pullulans TaxID=5580 RepID=A0ABR0TFE3_AURPU